MTGSTHPIVPQDFSIQVAENEGMPSRLGSKGCLPPDVRTRRLTGTLTLGLSKIGAATDGPRSARKEPMRHRKELKRHPLAKFFARLAVVAGLIASMAFPVVAQDGTRPIPANAQPKSYGEGWECDRGYRRDGDKCLSVIVPENAYATNRTYGAGWECLHGFQEVDDAACLEVVVPEGGYLDPSGQRWRCLRGYIKVDGICLEVVVPDNAYLSADSYGAAWLCNRGYQVEGDTCVAIVVPENAFLNASSYGQPWTCERGYFERDDTCETIVVPENAYFDEASYGPGWKCNRGFAESDDGCTEIDLPDNAHLDRSGNRWACHRNFQRSRGLCLLND